MDRKRFWVAVLTAADKRADWIYGGEQEARERWPGAASYTDATEMDDAEFERLILGG